MTLVWVGIWNLCTPHPPRAPRFLVLRCLLTAQRRDGKKPILRLSTRVCKERKAGIIPRELGVLFWMMGRCALDAIERSAVAYASYRDPVRCAETFSWAVYVPTSDEVVAKAVILRGEDSTLR